MQWPLQWPWLMPMVSPQALATLSADESLRHSVTACYGLYRLLGVGVVMAGVYQRLVLPRLVERACGARVLHQQRALLVPEAAGTVLEIGVAGGHNLRHYRYSQVGKLWAIDPVLAHHRGAECTHSGRLAPVLLAAQAEALPLETASFDCVVMTYTLCTIGNPAVALAEIRRVLRPGGRLLFCEHGLAPEARVRAWQRRLTPWWRRLAGGCHLDRDVTALIAEAGLRLGPIEQHYLPGWAGRVKPVGFHYRGMATAANAGS